MMKKTMLVAILAMFASTGCTLPEVKLKDALLTKLTTKDLEVGLNLEIFNPNEYSLPLQFVDWDLDLFQADFTSGKTGYARNIPAQRRADLQVPIGISFQSIQVGVQSLITKRQIPWGIGGGCSFRNPVGEPLRVGFSQSGSWVNPLMN